MYKFLTPATAIALALGLQGCAAVPTFPKLNIIGTSAPSKYSEAKGHMQEQMAIAEAAQIAGDSASAVRILRNLAREYPAAIRPRIKLGDALLAANAPQEAARAYQGANNVRKTLGGLIGLGRVHLALRKPADALAAFDDAAKIDADDTQVMNGRAVALDQLGRHKEAQAVYLTILEKEPSNIKIRNNYALSLGLAGNYDDAADILNSLVQVPDSEERIRQNLALVYGLQGNDGQAAHVGRIDLDEDAVSSNLKYYQAIRNLDAPSIRAAELTHPSARGQVRPQVSHYSSADAATQAGDVASGSVGPSFDYVNAPRAEAASVNSPDIASTDTHDVEASRVHSASEPTPPAPETKATPPAKKASNATSSRQGLLALPLTRAEASAQGSAPNTVKVADAKPQNDSSPAQSGKASVAAPAAKKKSSEMATKASTEKPASAPEKIVARQPAVPPFKESGATSNVTAATKKTSKVENPVGAERNKEGSVRLANASKDGSTAKDDAARRQGASALEANPIDTGVREPAVPALL